METLALDTGALVALSRGDGRVRRFLENAVNDDVAVVVPVPVLAETLRGGARDAPLHALLRTRSFAIEILTIDDAIGRSAGELLGRTAARNATVDALVVAAARAAQAVAILTSDPDDMTLLAEGRMHVIPV